MCRCDYIRLQTGAGKAYGTSEMPETQLRRLLERPDELLWQNLDRPVKIDHASLMVEAELPLPAGPVHAAYKRYRPRSWLKWLCSFLRRSPARRAWHLARTLVARQIATARPLAMLEPRRPRLSRSSYLATEWIESAENLHLYGWRLADRPIQERLRLAADCAESLGRLIGRMHARGIAHRDLKGANLLVAPQGDRTATYLIDTEGVRLCGRLRRKQRAANLARLAVSAEAHPWLTRTTYCRFLRAYLAQLPPETVELKSLWGDVARRTRRILNRKRRRGQQVL